MGRREELLGGVMVDSTRIKLLYIITLDFVFAMLFPHKIGMRRSVRFLNTVQGTVREQSPHIAQDKEIAIPCPDSGRDYEE